MKIHRDTFELFQREVLWMKMDHPTDAYASRLWSTVIAFAHSVQSILDIMEDDTKARKEIMNKYPHDASYRAECHTFIERHKETAKRIEEINEYLFSKEDTMKEVQAEGPFSQFKLVRKTDVTGISGTGIIAVGVQWPDQSCELFWLKHGTTGHYPSIGKLREIHCYNDTSGQPNAIVEWIKEGQSNP